ncbi:MAG: TonB family protein [Sulfurimonas sp.]|uniref:TonB family protein n=1 Tax=Sulfurimonas sp. TaxID=2022749 RepID=UPI0025DA85BE|nr:energy transducer TonB [Sulfurimonas sp.]MCK9492536.1 TonB family protein [Sulfurimonas sp.]
MIRHSSSIFLSLAFHTLIAVLVVFTYKSVISTKEEIVEKKVCIELCNVVAQKPIVLPKPKSIIEPKIDPKPITKKPEPKPTLKKVVKKEIIKEVPVVMPDPEPIVEHEVVKEKEIIEEKVEQISKQSIEQVPKETKKEEVKDVQSKEVKLQREYMQEHLAKIVQLLKENLYYPRRARAMQEEGEVIVKFVLSKDARVHSIEVISSKSKILSRSAIKTIEDLSGEFPRPKEDLTLHVPIDYSLR